MNFPVTRLSVVERTRSGDEDTRRIALATIIEAYWKPAYKYLRVKWSLGPDQAADLTQEFFTTTLEKDVVERYDPARARFRTYLRLCLDGFASNARKAERRLKRGGGVRMVPLDFETAEGEIASHEPSAMPMAMSCSTEWGRALLARSVGISSERRGSGRPAMFDVLRATISRTRRDGTDVRRLRGVESHCRNRDESRGRDAETVPAHRPRAAARADVKRRGVGSGGGEAAWPFDAPSGRTRPDGSLRAGR